MNRCSQVPAECSLTLRMSQKRALILHPSTKPWNYVGSLIFKLHQDACDLHCMLLAQLPVTLLTC